MADQNNFYPQQPQYVDPQGQNPFGQPQYTAAPVPAQQPAEPEPEVIIQEIGFADYGFSEGDSVTTGHDFGNIMDDDNSEPEIDDTFDAFNSQTPNFDPAAVEAAGRAITEEDKAMFTSMTPNLDLSAVEQASKTTTDFDRDVFSNAVAVGAVEQTVSETPTFDAATAAAEKSDAAPVDFLASMKSMFVSMNGEQAAPAPAYVPAPEPAPAPVAEPAPAPAPAPVPAPAPAPEIDADDDLIPEPLNGEPTIQPAQPAQPDTVTNASSYATINDVTNTISAEEKGPEYWENIDKMLGNFEKKPEPAAEAAPEPETEEPAAPEEEAESGFPFSESAQADDLTPEALTEVAPDFDGVIDTDTKQEEPAIPEETVEYEETDDSEEIDLFLDEKAAKAELKAEAKAAKARKKAEKKSSDSRSFIQKVFPARGDASADKALKLLAIFAALILVACVVYFIVSFIASKTAGNKAEKLAATVAAAENGNLTWNEVYEKYPGLNFPSGMQIKYADLYAINQDLVGWVKIPGLGIDYPVVKTADDTFYQTHDFYKKSDKDGAIFLSSKNNITDELDKNTVIYGHAIKKSGRMFSNLHQYKESSTFIENPIIEFSTLYGNYKFKVFCVFVTNGAAAQDNGFILDYTFPNLATTESLAGYIAEINQRRLYSTGVDILPTDKLICLSTASFEFENARLVVVGRMLRAGESEEIDASKVEENKNPRYPQAWYDANKVTNPYDKYSHWKPSY